MANSCLLTQADSVGAGVEAGASGLPCRADFLQKGLHLGSFPPGLKEQHVSQMKSIKRNLKCHVLPHRNGMLKISPRVSWPLSANG